MGLQLKVGLSSAKLFGLYREFNGEPKCATFGTSESWSNAG